MAGVYTFPFRVSRLNFVAQYICYAPMVLTLHMLFVGFRFTLDALELPVVLLACAIG